MPVTHSIAQGQYIHFKAIGAVTGAEILSVNQWLYAELPDSDLARFQLWDFSAATEIVVDVNNIATMAEQDKQAAQSLSQLVVACVAPGDLIYGLSRMWQAFAEHEAIEAHVFRDLGSAETWMLAQIASDSS